MGKHGGKRSVCVQRRILPRETLRELGRETLVAQKQSTALDRELASKRALVASKRLDLFQSYLSSRASEGR